ncbi:MAG: circadian clock KaiB family protein [Pseudomonadota bacterium]
MSEYVLKLYVSRHSMKFESAIANLRSVCEKELRGRSELTIINVPEQPQLAEDQRVVAMPTLVRVSPPPRRRIIGDLSDREKVLMGLDLIIEDSEEKGVSNDEQKTTPGSEA